MPNLCKGLESEPNEATLFGSDAHYYSESLIREVLDIKDYEEPIKKPDEVKKELSHHHWWCIWFNCNWYKSNLQTI